MIVRTFTGPTVREAIDRVREAFGGDAVILDTHVADDAAGGEAVRVTAAAESGSASRVAAPASEGARSLHVTGALAAADRTPETATVAAESIGDELLPPVESRLEQLGEALRHLTDAVTALRHHGGDDPVWLLLREWLATQNTLAGGIVEAFATHLAESLPPPDPFLDGRPRGAVTLFVGSRGTGKSTALFQALAARWRMRGRQPRLAVISDAADHGQERLAAWCDRCGIEFVAGQLGDSGVWKSLRHDRHDDLFVEYVANSRTVAIESTAKIIRRALKPDVVVQVLAATGSAQAWRHDGQRFLPFRPSHMLITRWDEMQPWWAVFNIARDSGLLPSYRTSGADPIDGIEPFTATDLRLGIAEHLSWDIKPSGTSGGQRRVAR